MNGLEQQDYLDQVHKAAPLDLHLNILFSQLKIGTLGFLETYKECLEISGTGVPAWKSFRRAQRAYNLACYFDYSLALPAGLRAECGVFRGFSSLLVSRVARMRDRNFRGAGLHLIDSFEGLSNPSNQDAIGISPTEQPIYPMGKGHFATPVHHVKEVLDEYPEVAIHKGWIPDAFKALPDTGWSFVHIDVDLYEPTLACLEYFAPRLVAGGVIVNDDYASPFFPGGGKAWDDYSRRHGLSFVALDTGQAVMIKAA